LRRRRVFRVAAIYGAGAFVVLQAADLVFPALLIPAWALRLLVVLALLGFPVALALAWAFDLTPAGVERAAGRLPPAARFGLAAAFLATLLLGGLWSFAARQAVTGALPPVAVQPDRSSIAVLPFVNLSTDEENAFFASGIHDELLIEQFQRAMLLDPRDARLPGELADGAGIMRDYPAAVRAADRALQLAPDYYDAASLKGLLYVSWTGSTDTLRAVVDRFTSPRSGWRNRAYDRFLAARLARDFPAALAAAEAAPDPIVVQSQYLPRGLLVGWARTWMGDTARARPAFEAARASAEAAVASDPEDVRYRVALGHALAGLGRRAEARVQAGHVARIVEEARDEYVRGEYSLERAAIFVRNGDLDDAIAELRQTLQRPAFFSAHDLRLDPVWDPLRSHPQYGRLLSSGR
jgi:hypothetical protein